MIARVAMSPAAVASLDAGISPADVFLRHAAICDTLEAHGFLVFSSDEEGRQFVRTIKATGPEVQALWTQLVGEFQRTGRFMTLNPPCPRGLDELVDLHEFAAGWVPNTDAAVVPDDRATAVFRLAPGVMSQVDSGSGIDVARAPAAAVSGRLAAYKRASRASVIPKDGSREELWRKTVLPIARVSRSLRIVDRYLFTNLANRTRGGSGNTSFVAWILEHLDQEAFDDCEVTLIGYHERRPGEPVDADAAVALVRDVFVGGGQIGSLDVVTAQSASYLPHDRHISSSIGVGITFMGELRCLRSRDRLHRRRRRVLLPIRSSGNRKASDLRRPVWSRQKRATSVCLQALAACWGSRRASASPGAVSVV